MTIALSQSERTRLAQLLRLLGSDFSGERDAAGLMAHKMIQAKGLDWLEVIDPAPATKAPSEIVTWRQTCVELQKRSGDLRAWERGFVANLPRFQRLSTKQRYILAEIATRVL
jgi:hypothetical protein